MQAVVGTDAVFLALDLDPAAREDCLGFAVHRIDHTEGEAYWLSGFKTFESVIPIPDPNAIVGSRDHPIQSFTWGDYTAKPRHSYTYLVVPRYGTPKNLADHPGVEATVDVATGDPDTGVHGIYFNRGIAASQAYARKFGATPANLPPDKRAEALTWLSRGLMEGFLRFIVQADSDRFALRAAVYQFTQAEVLRALRQAHLAGADVRIVYHGDGSEGARNAAAVEAALIKSLSKPRANAVIAHNKFVVLCEKDAQGDLAPLSVWTGSTNVSEGGVYGHSNVGHVVRDPSVAARYLSFWEQLWDDPERDELRAWVGTENPFDPTTLEPSDQIGLVLSPRVGLAPLRWYADRFGAAQVVAAITPAFGLTTPFEEALAGVGERLTYVLLNGEEENQSTWAASSWVQVAVGRLGGPNSLDVWAQEHLSGFNAHALYFHTKILLIDPLSADPTVVTGSANFSENSTDQNDENMLVIRGDLDVADTYFTEYTRIFNHFYARYWASRLASDSEEDRAHSFLVETDEWLERYFQPGNPKHRQRELFSHHVEGNA